MYLVSTPNERKAGPPVPRFGERGETQLRRADHDPAHHETLRKRLEPSARPRGVDAGRSHDSPLAPITPALVNTPNE